MVVEGGRRWRSGQVLTDGTNWERTLDSLTGLACTSTRGLPQLWQISVDCADRLEHQAQGQPLTTLAVTL